MSKISSLRAVLVLWLFLAFMVAFTPALVIADGNTGPSVPDPTPPDQSSCILDPTLDLCLTTYYVLLAL